MGPAGPFFFEEETAVATTYQKENTLLQRVAPRIESELAGVEVLALELMTPSRFCVYVDHPEGVDHALCKRVTDVLRDYLREYTIDVSSPGIERPVRKPEHFRNAIGRQVRLRTPERKRVKGEIVSAGEQSVVVRAGGDTIEILYDQVVRGNLVYEQ